LRLNDFIAIITNFMYMSKIIFCSRR